MRVIEGEIPGGDPVAGGTLRYGLEADVDGINPTIVSLSSPGLMMGNAVFDTLAAATVDGDLVPYLAESVDAERGLHVVDREAPRGHHIPRRHPAQRRSGASRTSRPSAPIRWSAWPSSRSTPRRARPKSIDDLTIQFNLLEAQPLLPGRAHRPARHGRLADMARCRARGPDPEPAAGRHRPVHVREPLGGLRHQVRPQRRLVERRGLPRRRRVLPGHRPGRPASTCCSTASSTGCTPPTRRRSSTSQTTTAIQNIIDDSGEESFAMINSAVPPFDDIRAREALTLATPLENYSDLIGLGVEPPADQVFSPGEPVLQPRRRPGGRRPRRCARAGGRVLRRAWHRGEPDAGDADLHRRQDQHRAASGRARRSSRPASPTCSTRAGAPRASTSPSTSCPRTSTSSRRPSASTTSSPGASSAPTTRRSTTCGCCAARSAASR